ncbi:MAG: hypothetical protein KJ893_11225 [Candidatus Omnitrophica bacterium]|nr:hypothetical protein [Candidatus Omnitrophota bacterium]MBU4478547.1 hypothetical protein [Candidatus Omnitrophota bacterium]MCG2702856.1 hypothetical protein [Candidatus Omnitrophota bacterium]
MAHSDNFKMVVETIEIERNNADSSGIIELRQTKENKLNTVPIEQIRNILQDLDFGAQVITVVKENRPNKEEPWPQLWDPRKLHETIFNSGISFTVDKSLGSIKTSICNLLRQSRKHFYHNSIRHKARRIIFASTSLKLKNA